MSEVVNSIFGRSQYDTTDHGAFVPASATPHTAEPEIAPESFDTTGIAAEETVEPAGAAAADDSAGLADENARGEEALEQAGPAAGARAAAATRGDTTVEDGVVAKVVDMLARKAEGVLNLDDTGISVDGGVVTVKLSVVLEFGHAVKAVAGQIRTSVIDAVEEFLGLDVAAVDVRITDVCTPDAS